jgi:hypothetical protein
MSIRNTGFAALVAAMLFATGASSQAAYTLTTSVGTTTGLTFVTALAAGATFNINGVTGAITATNGGAEYTTAGGSMVFLLNDVQTSSGSLSLATTNEQVYVSLNPVGDTSTFNFTTLIAVNGTAAFTESVGTNFLGGAGFTINGDAVVGGAASVTPTSVTQGSLVVTNVLAQTTSGNANSVSNPSVSATFVSVPEPASVAMLGLGLVSLGGFALRRRMAK